MSNFDKHVFAFSPTHIFWANSTIQRLQSIRKIINFWYTFGWKWWVISFRDYLGLSDACSYDVDDVIGRVDRFEFQNFCSPATYNYHIGRVCYVPSLYGPSLLYAKFVMGRVCYVPSWPDTPYWS